ncbi:MULTISPECIES: MarR family winged helix-turn-helix transcriptional regulator [unclassified Leisingera]|uniref:MarR family winged helix-turn-helix transcriptional regulator n=1 Tax=unclassified Leisingera TaxID=2614906 RepID=UPI00057DE1B1|nr:MULTISPECIES: MarR family transcriptional regulator [unclassified Leisingera]KIC15299.1 transcriptional regulator, MarR family protein [Leisingera sp. ANG-DT]KIC31429.1 transcriptional regulator, MarR family protein [Leisingera sp. ANG-S5]
MTQTRFHLHHSLGYQITMLARVIERRFEQRIAEHGLTRVTWCVLLAVGEEGLTTPSEIADFIGIDRTATSRALRQMEAGGLITRRSGEGDGRSIRVMLTAAGQAALQAVLPIAQENAAHFEAKLSGEELSELRQSAVKLLQDEPRIVAKL